MNNISFANPWLLLLLLLLPLIAVWYWWRYRHQHYHLIHSNATQLSTLPRTIRQRLYPLLIAMRIATLGLLIVALARPQSKLSRQETSIEGIDITIALDVSGSMLAEDFRPNRLEAAKEVATHFINNRATDRIGIVVFAGEAYTCTPLTSDHSVLIRQLKQIKSGQLDDGTALGDGLATAINGIKDSKAKSKVIILITDGINNMGSMDPMTAAEIAKMYNIRLYTIGVGRRGMAPYPFKVGNRTVYQNIPVEIDEQLLTRMAQTTADGLYFRSTNKKNFEEIFTQIDKMEKTKIDVTQYSQRKDEHQPWLLAALICLAIEELLRLLYFKR